MASTIRAGPYIIPLNAFIVKQLLNPCLRPPSFEELCQSVVHVKLISHVE